MVQHQFKWLGIVLSASLVACSTPSKLSGLEEPFKEPALGVMASGGNYIFYNPVKGDTLASIAGSFLGSNQKDWVIAEFNNVNKVRLGEPLVIPLKQPNPIGVSKDRYQTVPILCYHRFGPGSGKMSVSAAKFADQLDWLANNDFRVIPLAQLKGFLEGREALPKRSVVITIDDGYESMHKYALPALKKHGFPATLFVYPDFIGSGAGLSWSQLTELQNSGLVDIQSHSKTHRNLIERSAGETEDHYRKNLEVEVKEPRELIGRRISTQVSHFAFPYGDANELVLEMLSRHQFDLAVTVYPGGNPFFSHPLMLRRTMIFGDYDLETFKSKLQISRAIASQ